MRLIYTESGKEVKLGDIIKLKDGEEVEITYFDKPHKPASSGKVSVKPAGNLHAFSREYYVSVIGAEWIEREDRD